MSTSDNDNDQGGGSGDMKSNEKECTSCEQTNLNNITEGIDSVAIKDDISMCAACGEEGNSDDMNTCNKCKMVKYCNATCKKKHRSKHKKACEKLVAELHDEKLFKQPPPAEDCPICFLLMPILGTGRRYKTCCGKVICSGCIHAPAYDNQGNEVDNEKCPFCRTPTPNEEEMIKRTMKRMEVSDARAIYSLACYYNEGLYGFPQNYTKALELYHRAGELGHTEAYVSIGYCNIYGRGVEIDKKKAHNYYELAAMGGNVNARYNLGLEEVHAGNFDRALKHHMIASRSGRYDSLTEIKKLYSNGHATKEDYMKALQSYQEYLGEIKSKQRDEAAAANDLYRYY